MAASERPPGSLQPQPTITCLVKPRHTSRLFEWTGGAVAEAAAAVVAPPAPQPPHGAVATPAPRHSSRLGGWMAGAGDKEAAVGRTAGRPLSTPRLSQLPLSPPPAAAGAATAATAAVQVADCDRVSAMATAPAAAAAAWQMQASVAPGAITRPRRTPAAAAARPAAAATTPVATEVPGADSSRPGPACQQSSQEPGALLACTSCEADALAMAAAMISGPAAATMQHPSSGVSAAGSAATTPLLCTPARSPQPRSPRSSSLSDCSLAPAPGNAAAAAGGSDGGSHTAPAAPAPAAASSAGAAVATDDAPHTAAATFVAAAAPPAPAAPGVGGCTSAGATACAADVAAAMAAWSVLSREHMQLICSRLEAALESSDPQGTGDAAADAAALAVVPPGTGLLDALVLHKLLPCSLHTRGLLCAELLLCVARDSGSSGGGGSGGGGARAWLQFVPQARQAASQTTLEAMQQCSRQLTSGRNGSFSHWRTCKGDSSTSSTSTSGNDGRAGSSTGTGGALVDYASADVQAAIMAWLGVRRVDAERICSRLEAAVSTDAAAEDAGADAAALALVPAGTQHLDAVVLQRLLPFSTRTRSCTLFVRTYLPAQLLLVVAQQRAAGALADGASWRACLRQAVLATNPASLAAYLEAQHYKAARTAACAGRDSDAVINAACAPGSMFSRDSVDGACWLTRQQALRVLAAADAEDRRQLLLQANVKRLRCLKPSLLQPCLLVLLAIRVLADVDWQVISVLLSVDLVFLSRDDVSDLRVGAAKLLRKL